RGRARARSCPAAAPPRRRAPPGSTALPSSRARGNAGRIPGATAHILAALPVLFLHRGVTLPEPRAGALALNQEPAWSDLDLRTQFDPPVARDVEILDHAAGVARHGGEHALAPHSHAVC